MSARKHTKLLGIFCAALLAGNSAAMGAFAEGGNRARIFEKPDDAVLYWATQIGSDKEMWSDAPTGLTLGDNGYIYICSADNIYKIDKHDGSVIGSGKMSGQALYASKGPLYAEGMVFMALDGGVVQAFNGDTLEPLWIYRCKPGGSPACDIVYDGGCIFTGFWNGEEADADFVCISVKDEDTSRGDEEKSARWEYANKGGFYWTAAAFSGDSVIIGSENGVIGRNEEEGGLLILDRESGELIEKVGSASEDIRSKIVFADGVFYYTSRDGVLHTYSESLGASSADAAALSGLEGASCTSTPIAANGRVYMTLNGAGWDSYNGSMILVFDEERKEDGSAKLVLAYTLETAAPCQAQGVFAGVDGDGNNVIYYVENGYPGSLRILRDRAGLTEPIEVSEEKDGSGKVHKCAPVVFTPRGEHANYCAVDPVFDPETGLIYVRNDSFNILAIGAAVKGIGLDSPENTIHPKGVKTLVYRAGERVSDYEHTVTVGGSIVSDEDVGFSADKFAANDEVLTVSRSYGLYTGSGKAAAVSEDIDVLVAETEDQYARALAERGDLNGDGHIDLVDLSMLTAHAKSVGAVDKYSMNAADVNGDGQVDIADVIAEAAHVKNFQPITTER